MGKQLLGARVLTMGTLLTSRRAVDLCRVSSCLCSL
jgi:hypothetical protein